MWASYIFHFFTRILTSTQTKNLIFFSHNICRDVQHSLFSYWLPTTLISLVHNSLREMERCEKRVYQNFKMRKKKISWNIKTKWVTDYFWQLGLRVWRIILVITWWVHKRQTFTFISIKIMWILKFFVYT
jgi:hypothetical protein